MRSVTAIDLRALMFASIAVCPLFAWHIVDLYLWRDAYMYGPVADVQILLDYGLHILRLLIGVVGTVVVVLSVAFAIHRDRFQTFTFITTSLAFGTLIVALDGIASWIAFLHDSQAGAEPSSAEYALIVAILGSSGTLVGVALAASLYARWRSPTLGDRGANTAVALAAIVAVVVVTRLANGLPVMWSQAGTIPIGVLWSAQYALTIVVGAAGAIFLYGSAVIGLLHLIGRGRNPAWVLCGGVTAALVYWLVHYGPASIATWEDAHTRTLVISVLLGAFGGVLHMHAIDAELMRRTTSAVRSLADLPATIRKLRSWPYRPGDDEGA